MSMHLASNSWMIFGCGRPMSQKVFEVAWSPRCTSIEKLRSLAHFLLLLLLLLRAAIDVGHCQLEEPELEWLCDAVHSTACPTRPPPLSQW